MHAVFKPTPEQRQSVWACVALGITQEEIALAVINPETGRPISIGTLREHFPEELATARAAFKREIADGLVVDMRERKVNTTRIFLSKVVLGLRETVRNELTDGDGKPLDFRAISDAQLDALAKRLEG